jgi:hypothetical protein
LRLLVHSASRQCRASKRKLASPREQGQAGPSAKGQNEEAPQRKDIRRFLARPPPPSSPETIGGGGQKRSTIVSEIAYGLAGVGAGALPSGAAAAGYCERQSQGEIIRQRQRELTDAQTQLAVAQMNLQARRQGCGRYRCTDSRSARLLGHEAPSPRSARPWSAARNGFASNSSWSLRRSNVDARTLEKKSVSLVAVLAKG